MRGGGDAGVGDPRGTLGQPRRAKLAAHGVAPDLTSPFHLIHPVAVLSASYQVPLLLVAHLGDAIDRLQARHVLSI